MSDTKKYDGYFDLADEIEWATLRKLQAEALVAELTAAKLMDNHRLYGTDDELENIVAGVSEVHQVIDKTSLVADGDDGNFLRRRRCTKRSSTLLPRTPRARAARVSDSARRSQRSLTGRKCSVPSGSHRSAASSILSTK